MKYKEDLSLVHLYFRVDSMMHIIKKPQMSESSSVMILNKHLIPSMSSSHRQHRPSHGKSAQRVMIHSHSISKMYLLCQPLSLVSHDSSSLSDMHLRKMMHLWNCLSVSRYLDQFSVKKNVSWSEMSSNEQ